MIEYSAMERTFSIMKIPNVQTLKKSKLAIELHKAANSSFVARIIILIVIWTVSLIPTWLYLLTRALIDPFGFWEEIALFALFIIILGWVQFLLAVFGIVMSLVTMFEDI